MTEKFSDVHPNLYHYTNEQGLYGILKEQCLWATHYKFLNDSTEIELSKDKLRQIVYPCTLEYFNKIISEHPDAREILSENGSLEEGAKDDSELFIDTCYKYLAHEIYITSFCTESKSENADEDKYINENGILSQWRAYGGDGGYAVVLKTEDLKNMCNSENQSFHYAYLDITPVVYSNEDKKYDLMLDELSPHLTVFLQELYEQTLHGKKEPPDLKNILIPLMQCFTRYKHRGFKEEHEARIVARPLVFPNNEVIDIDDIDFYKSKPEKKREFRDKNGVQVPYIELFRSLDQKLAIEKIIVGPHRDKELRAVALRIMLRDTDLVDKVKVSKIPYI
jgi:Protein of unknown function (DUF2971)